MEGSMRGAVSGMYLGIGSDDSTVALVVALWDDTSTT